ncbi:MULTISPECIES: HU family DNA-binding protein [Fusobacterium]|uniref:HU family DNA-binding protein n=1 Tax=Fusobacterium TaxID=848 RepID=UPI001476B994|nr:MULTISPECIES: HU family DNA-binding protein [Fusobacterium]NME36123.1 integration host factor subunit alpha [Fusobacterium sp. FSA-380-WT-3A]
MMKKKDFVALYQELGNIESFSVAAQQVELFMETMKVAMEKDDLVILRKFGNFEKRILKGREGRNPKTGEMIMTETKYRVNFKPASTFNKRIDDFTKGQEKSSKKKSRKLKNK